VDAVKDLNARVAVAALMLTGCQHASLKSAACTPRLAPEIGTMEGGNMLVVYRLPTDYANAAGHLRYVDGAGVADGLVELFSADAAHCAGSKSETDSWPSSEARVAAVLSEPDGRFCLPPVPADCYELRASASREMNVTHLYLRLSPSGSKRLLDVVFEPGS
jgi:hypothetical protein